MGVIGTLEQCYRDMEEGVNDRTVNGQCSTCGACCSALLPLSREEINKIRKYVKKNGIRPHTHGAVFSKKVDLDLICPFLDERKEHKCDIYAVRPEICRNFICNVPPSKIEADKAKFWSERLPVNMWEVIE